MDLPLRFPPNSYFHTIKRGETLFIVGGDNPYPSMGTLAELVSPYPSMGTLAELVSPYPSP